jgi:hypothetical protein
MAHLGLIVAVLVVKKLKGYAANKKRAINLLGAVEKQSLLKFAATG